ncbi:MAG TPA: enoyl-CoA hydratase-related protein [Acidimicrobiales bacterium]|nr:enoyl-CoA hydratase-related protein [Acidimicrobiales bacterium]
MASDSSSPSSGLVTVDIGSDGVAVVTLANGKVNALSTAVLAELAAVAQRLTDDPPGAVLITGGPKLFAAGADITEFSGPEEARKIGGAFRDALDAVAAIPRIVIAAVNGVALGGGCELALACDLRVASTKAKFGQPEILLGIIPGGGGTQRLARLVGPAKAKDLICSGRQVRATEALEIGLVDELVDPDEGDEGDDAVLHRARELATGYAQGAVAAQGLAKRAIDSGLDGTLEAGLSLEQELFADVFATDDAGIGVASFLEHGPGKATFTGR